MTHPRPRFSSPSKKALLVVGAVVLSLAVLYIAFLFINPAYAVPAEIRSYVQDAVTKQQKIETGLRAYYQAGKYTFEEPLVVQDAYQYAPLTALVIFDTPDNSQISVHVPGKTAQSAVDFTFPGYQQHHEIPIYGLYADTLNHVTLSMRTQSGGSEQSTLDLQTEPLPVYLQTFVVDKLDSAKYSPGFNFTALKRKVIFDMDGDIRWYSTQDSWEVFIKLENGRFLFTYSVKDQDGDTMLEQDLLGKIYAIYSVVDGIHHDIYELPSGNLLVTSSDVKSDTIEDYLLEIDRNSGHVIHSFDMKNYLDEGRPRQVAGLADGDWLHLNSIVYDPTDRSIIISGKAQSAVVKLSYPGMKIQWILGPHDNWSQKFLPYLLTPVGDDFDWSWSQHHATLYGPNVAGDNAIDILLFDNGLYRSFKLKTAVPPSESYSAVVHYRIDEKTKTVEQVWEYGRENGSLDFSAVRGGAFLLPNGNVLGTWGDIYKDAQGNPSASNVTGGSVETKIIEIDPSSGDVVFECVVPHAEVYRTMRVGLYDGYSEGNDYLSTKLNDTTGNDLVDRSVMFWRDVTRCVIDPLITALKAFAHWVLAMVGK
jgi:arylsulfate sulfotransferase